MFKTTLFSTLKRTRVKFDKFSLEVEVLKVSEAEAAGATES